MRGQKDDFSAGRAARAAESAQITGDVLLAGGCSVWHMAVLRGDMSSITVGENTNIQDSCVVHVDNDYPVVIGKNTTVGHGAIVHGCTVGDGCLIGMGAILLSGCKIGSGAMVAAGAVVTQGTDIPADMVAMGTPARVVRQVSPDERRAIEGGLKEYLELSQALPVANQVGKGGGFSEVITTCSGEEEAQRVACELLAKRLAGCVQMDKVSSSYIWEGEVVCETEYRLTIKCPERCVGEIFKRIGEIHSYDVPQIIELPIKSGSREYLKWLDESCK